MQNRGKKIVLVEDDEGLNQAIARLLQAAGFEPLTFVSAEELLASDVAEHAALLVIDIHLPGISGLELHRQLAQRYDLGPTIFITARDDAKLRLQAHQVGQYLVKPFRGQSLLQMVEATLRQSG